MFSSNLSRISKIALQSLVCSFSFDRSFAHFLNSHEFFKLSCNLSSTVGGFHFG
jgi:hypothetical protein